ncbi:MAG: hypothetical protein QOD70_1202 [Frankiales bacterium]|nr:hypothetical protein [Frankiales bacterium]
MRLATHRPALKLAAALAVGATLTAACGARLTPVQRTAAIGQGSGQDAGGTGSGTTGTDGNATTGTSGTSTGTGTTGSTGTTGATGTTGTGAGSTGATGKPGTTGAAGGGTTGDFTKAPPGGNGGKTDTGITGNSITIYNISDVSGAVPGLFEDARFAVQAYFKYFNARYGTIYGRKINLQTRDSQLDTGANRSYAIELCNSGFAGVGSISAFDQGAAGPEKSCGVPDLRGLSTTGDLKKVPNVHPINAAGNGDTRGLGQFGWVKDKFPAAIKKAAYVYIDGDVTREQVSQDVQSTTAALGFDWVAQEQVGITETNYTSYVADLKKNGAQFVTFTGAYQQAANLVKEFDRQNFHPQVWEPTVTAYTPNYITQAGGPSEGTFVAVGPSLVEEMNGNAELQLYAQWLQQVKPGATPTNLGQFAWGAAAFFVQEMIKLGPKPTRKGLLALVEKEHNYTDNGLFPGQDVGGKRLSDCVNVVQVKGGKFVRYLPLQPRTWRCQDGAYNFVQKKRVPGYPK